MLRQSLGSVRVHVVINTCHLIDALQFLLNPLVPLCFYYSLFLQYMDHGILQLNGEFMAQLLHVAGTGIFSDSLNCELRENTNKEHQKLLKHINYEKGITDVHVHCDDMLNAISY